MKYHQVQNLSFAICVDFENILKKTSSRKNNPKICIPLKSKTKNKLDKFKNKQCFYSDSDWICKLWKTFIKN